MDQHACGRRRRGLVATGLATALVVTAATAATADDDRDEDGPENVFVFIGDGYGYNHVAATNLYETGQADYQVVGNPGDIETLPGDPVQVYEHWDVVAMSTYQYGNSYDPERAWSDFEYINESYTDSAAAGTALATGVKTNNGVIGLDHEGNRVENLTERAISTGRAAGVVSSVPFSHATPAAYVAHNSNRNALQAMANEMIESDVSVIMGPGHPEYTDANQPRVPQYQYISQSDFDRLQDGQTDFTYIEEKADFEALAEGDDVPDRVFGLPQVATTLQDGRAPAPLGSEPYDRPLNEGVPSLETMTEGAINVLEQDDDGFFLMVEGGAIDWAGHANNTVRTIEESQDFNASIEAAVRWVESESSWDETLIIVTADHETGYLAGPGSGNDEDPVWTPMTGEEGRVPNVGWYSPNHTNQLVPVFVRGAGADTLLAHAEGTDPIRGAYLDNTDVANFLLEDLWATQPSEDGIPIEAEIPRRDDDDDPVPGALVLSVADGTIELDDPRHAGDRLRLDGELPTVAVTDSRREAAGWAVSGQSSDLADDGRIIRAGHLGWTPGLERPREGVTPGPRVRTVMSGGEGLADPATLATANATGRVGTAHLDADIELEVPVNTREGSYRGTFTVSLFPVD